MRCCFCLVLSLLVLSPVEAQGVPVGSCERGTTTATLQTSSLSVPLFNDGHLFWDYSDYKRKYRVLPDTLASPVYAGNLWLSGYIGDSPRVAAAAYDLNEFWPGPLVDAEAPPSDCSAYDRIWTVSRSDVEQYHGTGRATRDLSEWPYQSGAPVIDGDGDPSNYDLAAGDQPRLIGDAAAFWVMNDAGNAHTGTGSAPLGVEVRALAFAFEESPFPPASFRPLRETLFLRYEIVNRRSVPIDSLRLSLWSDVDLGEYNDDYVGTDTLRHLVYVYNADNLDDGEGVGGYGEAPPAWGILFLRGLPAADNGRDDDRDGVIDEPGERSGLTTAPPAPKNTPFGSGDPYDAEHFLNMQRGRFEDGTPVIQYGYGHAGYGFDDPPSDARPTVFGFPASPADGSFWSALDADGNGEPINPGDRRMVGTTGPTSLGPGDSVVVDLAFPFARGSDHLRSVAQLSSVANGLLAAFGEGFPSRPVERPAERLPDRLAVSRVRPNPTSGSASVTLSLPESAHVEATVHDALGRRLAVIASGTHGPGTLDLTTPDGLPAGAYVLRIRAGTADAVALPFTVVR
ncbi:MAG: T9SS type A sorting domain-containing protein [Bacteroidota bacterium]